MKKIPTLFERVFENHKVVEVKPITASGLCGEAFTRGIATIKLDGSCCAIICGELYKRYDAKKGKPIPEGAIKCQENADAITGHLPCWVKCDKDNPADKWFFEALKNCVFCENNVQINGDITTFEAVGKHFNGNPYNLDEDRLYRHGCYIAEVERTFEGVKKWLKQHNQEGLVFWLDGKPICKIKRSDFGFEWGKR